jgi:hypothetical protein
VAAERDICVAFPRSKPWSKHMFAFAVSSTPLDEVMYRVSHHITLPHGGLIMTHANACRRSAVATELNQAQDVHDFGIYNSKSVRHIVCGSGLLIVSRAGRSHPLTADPPHVKWLVCF